VPNHPTQQDKDRARSLLQETICDFPFIGEAERANAIALCLLPFVRNLIVAPTPLHSTLSTTADIYTSVDEEQVAETADALGKAFCGRSVVETPCVSNSVN